MGYGVVPTILTRDEDGAIAHVVTRHRLMEAAIGLSAEFRYERLAELQSPPRA